MTNSISPYFDQPIDEWPGITQRLLSAHPLKIGVILEVAEIAWANVWATKVGSGAIGVPLADLSVPATVVGYFFEVLASYSRRLSVGRPRRTPRQRRGENRGAISRRGNLNNSPTARIRGHAHRSPIDGDSRGGDREISILELTRTRIRFVEIRRLWPIAQR